ncbi:MAG: CHAD domain-containing protein [Nitrospira defluvii]|nr:CHAD domain-containing protein [Nitrospira defluvii]
MPRSSHTIHTDSRRASQDLSRTAAEYQATVLRLVRRLIAGQCPPDRVHAIRTHCRRLQALLELCGDDERALVIAQSVRRLSKLRALQVFHQYLRKIEAPQADVDALDAWIVQREQKLRHTQAYQQIEQAVWKHALPTNTHLNHSLKDKLDVLCHVHEKKLAGLISAASEKPRRKRLHALRLALKTIRYQTEWLPGRRGPKQALVKRIKRVQAVLGRYEEMADFRRWGKELDLTVRARIQKDWKRARKRARAVPAELTWLVDAMASGHVWIGIDEKTTLLGRHGVRTH